MGPSRYVGSIIIVIVDHVGTFLSAESHLCDQSFMPSQSELGVVSMAAFFVLFRLASINEVTQRPSVSISPNWVSTMQFREPKAKYVPTP